MFDAPFIKCETVLDNTNVNYSPAPIFRRRFNTKKPGNAVLRFCGLGYGYCYINGRAVTEDLFTAPVSEYDKLVWYNEYDVSDLLQDGENIIAVILGNGFFNENFPSAWNHNEAVWRDNPKFALELIGDEKKLLQSDELFKCKNESFVTYNELRSGETFNAQLYNENWENIEFDDSDFDFAVTDTQLDGASRKLCTCEPIREFEVYDFVSATETNEGYLLDFGINSAGYLRICVDEPAGTVIEMRHAEEANPDGSLKLNGLDIFYPTVDFQVDRYICGDKKYVWSPKFTYHGFRFVLVKGLKHVPRHEEFKAVFVHQAVERNADFCCSNELINKIYKAGIRSVYSNLHYALTDCPTREKLGWTNDAQATIEQMYINFNISSFMEKWGTDIMWAVRENGEIPAIVPSNGWGLGHGPVADGILFKLPLIDYIYTGNDKKLKDFLPYQKRYYDAFVNGTTFREWWLCDWDGLTNRFKDDRFTYLVYSIIYCKVLMLAEEKSGLAITQRYHDDLISAKKELKEKYIDENGYSVVDLQTVIAILLNTGVSDKKPLIEQLKKRIEADNYHITSGMWGIQYIYDVLFENGLGEYAYRLITAKGAPSYENWFNQGATTLWETWENRRTDSKNHQMFSNVLSVFHKYLLGIAPCLKHPGYREIELNPCFIEDLDFCKGYVDTPYGRLSASWERDGKTVTYKVSVPHGITAYFQKKSLNKGENTFIIK